MEAPLLNDDATFAAEETRNAFLHLAEAQRVALLKTALPRCPRLTRALLRGARIPPSFQPARVANWLRPEQLPRLEPLLLADEFHTQFRDLLVKYFAEGRRSMNDAMLAHAAAAGEQNPSPASLAAALAQFPDDPYRELFAATVRWMCAFQSVEDAALTELAADAERLRALADQIEGAEKIEPVSATTLIEIAIKRVNAVRTETLTLALEAGEGTPSWSDAEELRALRGCLRRAIEDARCRNREAATQRLRSAAARLSAAKFTHKLPKRAAELVALAGDAATQLEAAAEAEPVPAMDGPTEGAAWLEWLWQQEGAALEAVLEKIAPHAPALANLLTDAPQAPCFPIATPPASESVAALNNDAPSISNEPPRAIAVKTVVDQGDLGGSDTSQDENESPPSGDPKPSTSPRGAPFPEPSPEAAIVAENAESSLAPAQSVAAPETFVPAAPDVDVWALGRAQRWGLAAHLAEAEGTSASMPPGWVFRVAALGSHVSYEISGVSEALAETLASFDESELARLAPEAERACRLILAANLLRPALLAPMTSAAHRLAHTEVRERLKLAGWGKLVDAVADYGRRGTPLTSELAGHLASGPDRAQQRAATQHEAREWFERAPKYGFNFAPASQIWRRWTGTGGRLSSLMRKSLDATTRDWETLSPQWQPWNETAAELIDAEALNLGRRALIDGWAREHLLNRVSEACQIASRLRLLAGEPPSNSETAQIGRLRKSCTEAIPLAEIELAELAAQAGPMAAVVPTAAVALQCLRTIVLEERLPEIGNEPAATWLIDAELLCARNWPTSGDRRQTLRTLAAQVPDWGAAWTRHEAAENHTATGALLEGFAWQPPAEINVTALAAKREDAIRLCRDRLHGLASDVRRELDHTVGLGFCRQQDYDEWANRLGAVERALGQVEDFRAPRAQLTELQDEMRARRTQAAGEVRSRLEKEVAIPKAARARIEKLLTDGDVHTANEYLEITSAGRPLPEATDEPALFHRFCGAQGWLPNAEAAVREFSVTEFLGRLNAGEQWQGLDFDRLNPAQRQRAANELQLWLELERTRQASELQIRELCATIGFVPVRASRRGERRGATSVLIFNVQTEPVSDRTLSPVPAYGSDARGHYTVLCVWGEPNPDSLISSCATEARGAHPLIVIRFGAPFTLRDRRALGRQAREQVFPAPVIDRALFLFALAQPGPRLSVILEGALPFASVSPYSDAAGLVPPEMFYGRNRELASLEDPRGSCFVYGGRQLGKTALLRELERSLHRPALGRIAVWLDLKNELLRGGRLLDDLWTVFVEKLNAANFLPKKLVGNTGQVRLFEHLREWLDGDPNRRLLLLLDEADSFLEADATDTQAGREPFSRCRLLSTFMQETARRFKVIFAGLHNVQRTTRVANNPLAHFGTPICVGPLIEEADARAARELIERPLACAGYWFESPDAVSRMLALTNYYPSLIQLFCQHLLRDLARNHLARFPQWRETPPCLIRKSHVDDAYSVQIRAAIHDKFKLTLDLDRRYELIAYLLAYYHLNQTDMHGVAVAEIWREARQYWPKGFVDTQAEEEFRVLLEEMAGLGILREVRETRAFALRNPNVVTLLGAKDEIETKLLAAADWEAAQRYEPEKFRRTLANGVDRLSPLTAMQENELRNQSDCVVVVRGSKAGGFDDLPSALRQLFGSENLVLANMCRTPADLHKLLDRDNKSGAQAVFVPSETPWDGTWLTTALERLARFHSERVFTAVVFAECYPPRLGRGALPFPPGVRALTLGPVHDAMLRLWLHDRGLPSEPPDRAQLLDLTGGWPILLASLAAAKPSEWKALLQKHEARLLDGQLGPELCRLFGLEKIPPDGPLARLAARAAFAIEELDDEMKRSVLEARDYGLLRYNAGLWQFDPLVVFALQAIPAA